MNPKPHIDVSCCRLHIKEAKKEPSRWYCGRCGSVHTSKETAEACCKPAPKAPRPKALTHGGAE